MKMLKSISLLFLLCFLCGSCINRPDVVIAPDEMVDLLVDIHKTEGLLEVQGTQYANDSLRKSLMASVYVRHGVSKAQYDSSLIWYSQNLKQFIRVYDRVQERLAEEIELLNSGLAVNSIYSPQGDSLDVWPYEYRHVVLDPSMHKTLYRWEVVSDSNFVAGDSMVWQFSLASLPSEGYGVATLSVLLGSGELQSVESIFSSDTLVSLSFKTPNESLFKSVMGSFVLISSDSTACSYLDHLQLYRYHPQF